MINESSLIRKLILKKKISTRINSICSKAVSGEYFYILQFLRVLLHEEIVICKRNSQNVNIILHLSNPHHVLKVLRTVQLNIPYASEKGFSSLILLNFQNYHYSDSRMSRMDLKVYVVYTS